MEVRRLAFIALYWSFIQSVGGRLVSLIFTVIIARLVSPSDLGIFTAALIFYGATTLVSDAGLGDAIVQRLEFRETDINLPFYFILLLSCSLATALIFSASDLSYLVGSPASSSVLIGLACLVPMFALSSFQEALFRRQQRYKFLATRTMCGLLLGGCVGVAVASSGYGVWALFWQYAVQVVCNAVLLWIFAQHVPGRHFDFCSFKELFRFGSAINLYRLVDFASGRVLDLMILLKFGVVALGLYSVAFRLFASIVQSLQVAIWNVSLSTLSRISRDKSRLSVIYLECVTVASFTGSFLFLMLCILSNDIVIWLFGNKWNGSEEILKVLFISGIFVVLHLLSTSFLTSMGLSALLITLGLVNFLLISMNIWIFAHTLDSVVYVYLIATVTLCVISMFTVCKETRCSFLKALRSLCVSFLVGAASCASALQIQWLFVDEVRGFHAASILVIMFCVSYCLFSLILNRAGLRLSMRLFLTRGL